MVAAQKPVALLLLLIAIVDAFRVRPQRRNKKQVNTQETQDPAADPVEVDQEEMIRRFTVASREMGKSMHPDQLSIESLPSCRLGQSNCNIGDMSGATLVYTDDDNSRCLNGDPFAFIVKPGRTDKLMFYFPGGGACWQGSKSQADLCTDTLQDGLSNAGLGSGISNGRADNNFRDFTFVAPAYCDGGAYVSNTTLGNKNRPQTGYLNVKYAADWAKRNLDSRLSRFAIAGSSAGALGTMAWSDVMLTDFQYEKATVVVDSYMGVFPSGTQGPTIKNFGACNSPLFANFRSTCEAGNSNIQDVFDYTIQKHPNVAFSMIQPKGDIVQIGFYAAIAVTFGRLDIILANTMYERTNTIMKRFSRHDNFVHFHIDGAAHTFLQTDKYFSQTTGGRGSPTLAGWTGELVEHQPVSSACNGPLQKNGGNGFIFKNTKYCYKELYPEALKVR